MRLRLLNAAFDEMEDAARYYESQVSGLGQEFLDMMNVALDTVADNPMMGSKLDLTYRKIDARRFPFTVIYRIEGDEIVVTAIAHQRRMSGYWRDRL